MGGTALYGCTWLMGDCVRASVATPSSVPGPGSTRRVNACGQKPSMRSVAVRNATWPVLVSVKEAQSNSEHTGNLHGRIWGKLASTSSRSSSVASMNTADTFPADTTSLDCVEKVLWVLSSASVLYFHDSSVRRHRIGEDCVRTTSGGWFSERPYLC